MSQKGPRLTLVAKKSAGPPSEIDELYQLPRDAFTAARNELAKRFGTADPPIKSLEKPSVPAWAVNQLYWRERATYDQLVAAAERLRAEHRNLLAGKASNIRETEREHREAIRRATDKVKDLLAEGNETATPATLTAIAETLEALPSADPPGRLTRPLKPGGFEALTGVPVKPSRPALDARRKTSAAGPGPRDAAALRREAARREREAEAVRRQAAKEKERLLAEARRAKLTLDKAQAAVSKAEEEVARREQALADARKSRDRLRDEASIALSAYQRATRLAHE